MIDKRLFFIIIVIFLFVLISFEVYGNTITTVYNFSGITKPSSTYIAYNGSASNKPWNRSLEKNPSEFLTIGYTNISNNDNKNYTTKTVIGNVDNRSFQFFNFTLNTPSTFSDFQQINVSWKGEGAYRIITPARGTTVYFWNWSSINKTKWTIMGGSASLGYRQVNKSFSTS